MDTDLNQDEEPLVSDADKEEIYNDQVVPLLKQIFDICRRCEIEFAGAFYIPTPLDHDLHSVTVVYRGHSRLIGDVGLRSLAYVNGGKKNYA